MEKNMLGPFKTHFGLNKFLFLSHFYTDFRYTVLRI